MQRSNAAGGPADEKNKESSSIDVEPGQILDSGSTQYSVVKFIGSGAFGKVARTLNLTTKRSVALKILSKEDREVTENEIEILQTIRTLDPVKSNIVQFLDMFEHKGLTCLVFEMLDRSLLDLMNEEGRGPFSLSEIRPMAQQLLTAFDALQSIGIMYTDLKPDNVMMVNQKNQPFRVKLIDFGLSIKTSEAEEGWEMMVVPFRAPEVFLGLPLSAAVDMWALGCLLSLLYICEHLFGDCSEYGTMRNIVGILGQPADHLLTAGGFTEEFFVEDKFLDHPKWWLKTPKEFQQSTGIEPTLCKTEVNSLDDLVTHYPEQQGPVEIKDCRAFVSLLKGLLNTDPKERISPKQALRHPFISMVHLQEDASSQYVNDAKDKMVITHRNGSEEDHMSPAAADERPEKPDEAEAATSGSAEADPAVPHMDQPQEDGIIEKEDHLSPAAAEDKAEILDEAEEAEAAASGSAEDNPAVTQSAPGDGSPEEEMGSDSDGSPAEVAPVRKNRGQLRRTRPFFGRVFGTMFCFAPPRDAQDTE